MFEIIWIGMKFRLILLVYVFGNLIEFEEESYEYIWIMNC